MPGEIIHHRLLHPSVSVMKLIFHHQTLNGLPEHCPNKLKKSPRTICYTTKNSYLPKVKTVDTSNLLPGELIHMDVDLYNITSIRGFTSMVTVVFANTIMLCLLPTVSKRAPVRIIRFILTTLNN